MQLLRLTFKSRYPKEMTFSAWQAEEKKSEGATLSDVEIWNGTNKLQTQVSPSCLWISLARLIAHCTSCDVSC